MKKSLRVIALMMAFIYVFQSNVFASVNVSEVQRLSVDSQIKGIKVGYTMDIPPTWKTYIIVERESLVESASAIEQLNFYYSPVSSVMRAELILNLYLYAKSDWNPALGYTIVKESEDYVMGYKLAAENPFALGTDRLIFDNLLKEAKKDDFLQDYISFPAKDGSVKYTISVNGKRMVSKAVISSMSVVYLPVREVCNELGYSVDWSSGESIVTVSNGSFFTSLGTNINKNKKYNLINFDGTGYVSTMFFLQILKCDVEIDENSNVRIIK